MRINIAMLLSCLGTIPLLMCSPSEKKFSEFEKTSPLAEKFEPLPLSEIKPTGWLKEQIQNDLDGFVGNLDSLVPDLIIKDDIYGENRLTTKVKSKDVGAISDGGDWEVQFLWWNSETQGNWWDAYIRNAILAKDTTHLARINNYIQKVLSTQDPDGYLGIYDKELRYKFTNENGELWAKAVLLRGLLGWYEYSKDPVVLNAIVRASENVMANYPEDTSHPFYSTKPDVGGLSHGLMITDVFENLYRITKQEKYRDYCLFLYKDFSIQSLNEDAQYKKLISDTVKLRGHGAHTYEHLRAVAAAYYASGNPKLKRSLDNFLSKIATTLTPSGGPIGDEWIKGRPGNATTTGYEYCSIFELMNGYTSLLQKTGQADFATKAEHLFFNAAQGARDPSHSCIAYLKTDNSYQMTGGQNFDTTEPKQTRYKYSPAHQDAAVCCVPNAGRTTPYYVQSMWMKDQEGLVATLLGPCEVSTNWKNQAVTITESTSYPDNFAFQFLVTVKAPLTFALKIRKPDWAISVITDAIYTERDGFIVMEKVWSDQEKVEISFVPQTSILKDRNAEIYFTHGPFVLAHPIESNFTEQRKFLLADFADYLYTPLNPSVYQYTNVALVSVATSGSLRFETTMHNTTTRKNEKISLVPMGKTILRQVTFQHK